MMVSSGGGGETFTWHWILNFIWFVIRRILMFLLLIGFKGENLSLAYDPFFYSMLNDKYFSISGSVLIYFKV